MFIRVLLGDLPTSAIFSSEVSAALPVIAAATIASLLLLWRLLRWLRKPRPVWVVVDGSNVMHWGDGQPSLDRVRALLGLLAARGWRAAVIFDANAGYKIGDRYLGDRALARALALPSGRVLVVPKGTQADIFILRAARDMGARVVTNDRYRDWVDDHPEVQGPGYLIKGGMRNGEVWIDA